MKECAVEPTTWPRASQHSLTESIHTTVISTGILPLNYQNLVKEGGD